jgi:glycosyltransferase involved in cell wall biosynthesis
MRRLAESPAFVTGVFLLVLLAIGIYPGGQLGDTIAFGFAILWVGIFHRRRFATRLSLVASFLALCLLAAFHVGAADAFGDGFFVSMVAVLLTMRRRVPGSDLRVLLVTRHDAERVGGTETYLRNFLRSVDESARDLRVTFATFDQGIVHREYERTKFFAREGGRFFRYTRANETRVVRASAWNTIVMLGVATNLAAIAIAAADGGEVDVVYGVGGMIPNLAAIGVGIALSKPVLCHFHMDFFFARYPAPLRALLRAVFSRARFLVANTQASIDDFVAIGYPGKQCEVLANWVFPQDFQGKLVRGLRVEPDEKIALFVGRLHREKGIELVLRAFDRTPESIRLVVAGDGVLHDAVKRWTETRSQVTWLGEVAHERMPDLLASADCLVWGSIDRDALSLAAIEALAAGLPVVASRRSTNMFDGAGETLPSTLPPDVGILCEPDEEAIAQAVTAICSWDREAARERCRTFADRRYSPSNFDRLVAAFDAASRPAAR